jgi:hypothetical protein
MMIDMPEQLREYAKELNREFVRQYHHDPEFRRTFNQYLRSLGVRVLDDPPHAETEH